MRCCGHLLLSSQRLGDKQTVLLYQRLPCVMPAAPKGRAVRSRAGSMRCPLLPPQCGVPLAVTRALAAIRLTRRVGRSRAEGDVACDRLACTTPEMAWYPGLTDQGSLKRKGSLTASWSPQSQGAPEPKSDRLACMVRGMAYDM